MGAAYNPPFNAASPPPIGNTTPNTGAFTNLSTTGTAANVTFGNTGDRTSGATFQSEDGNVEIFDRRIEFNAAEGFLNLSQSTLNINNGAIKIVGGAVSILVIGAAVAVASLPTGPLAGQIALVNDATVAVYGSTVVGGGGLTLPVMYNGSNWIEI